MQSEPALTTTAEATPTSMAVEALAAPVVPHPVTATVPKDAILLRGWRVVAVLSLGYIGVYLCRKNLSVAVPLLQRDFAATKEQVGIVASVGTFGYAIGKFVNGALVDRIGGRLGFLLALGAVAAFGAAGALAPGLGMLAVFYGLNRYAGSGGWCAMVKIIPSWFGVARTATVIAVMSLSYVIGGVAAILFARQVVAAGGGWRWVMGVPSIG